MEFVVIAVVGGVGFLLMKRELDRREPREERLGVTEAMDGRPATVEYEVHQSGKTYHAHRNLFPTTVYDLCPYCGGKVVVTEEEEAWMGGHSTSIPLVYACESCGHAEEENFGVEGIREIEGHLIADDEVPKPAFSVPLVLLGLILVIGVALTVLSFVTGNTFWRTIGIGCALVGIAFLGTLAIK